ncbi:MAG: hypothetical protein KJ583_01760 [Nanoarchaeota archaeon]|nr:hypothetical protein [Nanoarchaeota archaeon]MBU1269717.1 hypothetical protein [Nanoarchaeota archaeon]MBU1604018.1 hypothetical protein [Nanoarchaeota archaeon]MBU2443593.1 hypothetical protein [Nanoarchaeota archaeon]
MKIGIVGPLRIDKFCEVLKIEKVDYEHFIYKLSEYLASTGHELVITPDVGSVQEMLVRTYKDFYGKRVFGIVPLDDDEFGVKNLDLSLPDEVVDCKTWRNQPEKLCEESDILLVLGLSPGAMVEICYSKWFKVKKVYIFEEFISGRLHLEIEKDVFVEYINLSDLKDKIK